MPEDRLQNRVCLPYSSGADEFKMLANLADPGCHVDLQVPHRGVDPLQPFADTLERGGHLEARALALYQIRLERPGPRLVLLGRRDGLVWLHAQIGAHGGHVVDQALGGALLGRPGQHGLERQVPELVEEGALVGALEEVDRRAAVEDGSRRQLDRAERAAGALLALAYSSLIKPIRLSSSRIPAFSPWPGTSPLATAFRVVSSTMVGSCPKGWLLSIWAKPSVAPFAFSPAYVWTHIPLVIR